MIFGLSYKACPHIKDVGYQICASGKTTRFKFRGSTDHFCQDIIVLYCTMKNSISSDRYALITDAAAVSIDLSRKLEKVRISIYVEDIGSTDATKFESTEQVVRNWPANSKEAV